MLTKFWLGPPLTQLIHILKSGHFRKKGESLVGSPQKIEPQFYPVFHDLWPMFCTTLDHRHCASQHFLTMGMAVMRPVATSEPHPQISWAGQRVLSKIDSIWFLLHLKNCGEVPQNGICWFIGQHSSQPSTTDWVCANLSICAGRKTPAWDMSGAFWWHVRLWFRMVQSNITFYLEPNSH